MKNSLFKLSLFVCMILTLSACTKKEIDAFIPPGSVLSTSYWNLAGQNFTGPVASRVDTTEIWSCNGKNSFQVFFKSFPTGAGYYQIVDEAKAASHTLGPKECAIEINKGDSNVYLSMNIVNDSLSVRIGSSNNKLDLVCPGIKLQHIYIPTASVIDTLIGDGGLEE